ncbi:MAG TPA: alpha/beta hydrolase [Nitriliruptorales bacterium]|nr:alpha/beta hydrolase [Nitriliruptorales bacterium]
MTFPDVFCVMVADLTGRETRETAHGNQRTHHVTTTDGVIIGATVHGQGPPLVFLHGMLGDGDIDWNRLVGHLTGRFTCHLPSQRGRGLSGDHPDLSYGRQVDDFLAYVDSIGEPTGLVGWSGGAWPVLARQRSPTRWPRWPPFEPEHVGLADEQEQAAFGNAVARAAELATEGDLTAAVRPLAGFVFNDEEIAVLEDAGYLEATGRYVPKLLNFFQQLKEYEGPPPEDPVVLGGISAPVLVLLGSDTKPLAATSARHVADHVPNARIQEIPGAGHAAPLTHPEPLAEALTEFFATTQQPA